MEHGWREITIDSPVSTWDGAGHYFDMYYASGKLYVNDNRDKTQVVLVTSKCCARTMHAAVDIVQTCLDDLWEDYRSEVPGSWGVSA